jgi:hypothetical protein
MLGAIAVDAAFTSPIARDGTYTAPSGGEPVPCRIIRSKADETAPLGRSSFVAQKRVVEVRRKDIGAPETRGLFLIKGAEGEADETVKVAGAPHRKDTDGLVWVCLCDPVAA